MAQIWEQNEERDEDEELVITSHRDDDEPNVSAGNEEEVEVPQGESARDALRVLGEDVASSPARRGHDNAEEGAVDSAEADNERA